MRRPFWQLTLPAFPLTTTPSLPTCKPLNSEMFGGTHPFSEPQSRMIARLALSGGVPAKAYLNVHSGEWAAYSGWDSKGAVGPGLPVSAGPCFAPCGIPLASRTRGVLVHKRVSGAVWQNLG